MRIITLVLMPCNTKSIYQFPNSNVILLIFDIKNVILPNFLGCERKHDKIMTQIREHDFGPALFYLPYEIAYTQMKQALIILTLSVLLFSCGEYEKLLQSDDFELKLEKAKEYYDNEQYIKAVTVYEQLIGRYQASAKAEEINYYHAKSYFGMRDYILAGHYFETFYRTYGSSQYREEAAFMASYCNYLLSPRPSLDQEYTLKAIEGFSLFQRRFPYSERIDEAKEIIRELENKLAEKAYMGARLYYDLGHYKAAVVALSNSLRDYPDSPFREEEVFLKLKSSFLLAENSVSDKKRERYQITLDEYYSYIEEFPEGEFAKDARKIYEDTADVLGIEVIEE